MPGLIAGTGYQVSSELARGAGIPPRPGNQHELKGKTNPVEDVGNPGKEMLIERDVDIGGVDRDQQQNGK